MTEENKRRGQLQAMLLMLVVALPMIAAYIIYHTGWGIPQETVNQGELLQPPQLLTDLELTLSDGSRWDISAEKKHWRYVIPGLAECDQTCMDNLYLTRQVHVRLNEKAQRVERIYLLLEHKISPKLAEYLAREHPRLRVMQADKAQFQHLLSETNFAGDPVAAGRYFLMDQEGYLMMTYHPGNTGNQLLKDIKKMLRLSYEN